MTQLVTGALTPTVVYIDNPFGEPVGRPLPVRIGAPLRDTYPRVLDGSPRMLRVNSQWLLQRDWDGYVQPGDRIEWHLPRPSGGGQASRLILTVIAFIAIAYLTQGLGSGWGASLLRLGLGIAATALINALVPINTNSNLGNQTSPQSVYNVQASANQARLNAPIPVIYGRMLTYPDFASQPYGEYINNDQYYYALFCISQGEIAVEDVRIDDTPVNQFQDIFYSVLPAGILPSIVHPNVVTAPEVGDNDLNNADGTTPYCGFFVANGPLSFATDIGIDITFDQGLANIDSSSGNYNSLTINWRVEYQYVDDFGTPLGPIMVLGNASFTASTNTPQRITNKYTLPTQGRVQVRITRLTKYSDNSTTLNSMSWTALRAYLQYDPTMVLSPTATHLEVRMRASKQLNNLTERKISVISQRLLPTWDPNLGWSLGRLTRNPAWALADVWRNADYGDALPDSRIDIQTIYDLSLVWAQRQDNFDILVDSTQTAWEMAKTVCQAGRATPFRRYGICTLVRDQQSDLPVTSFTSRNIRPATTSISYVTANEDTADGVIIEYFDYRLWDWYQVPCNAPGITNPVNAVVVRINGITGQNQAIREGLYMAAVNVYRRKFPSWQTEMLGLLPTYGETVLFSPTLVLYASSGDVVDYDPTTMTLTTSEPNSFDTPNSTYDIRFQKPDGSITMAIYVTQTSNPLQVVLEYDPGFNMNLSDPSYERPKYIFGRSDVTMSAVKIVGITKQEHDQNGIQYVTISGVTDDPRVYLADNAYLPSYDGTVQDNPTPPPPPANVFVVQLYSHSYSVEGTQLGNPTDGYRPTIQFSLNTDGSFTWKTYTKGYNRTDSGSYFEQWALVPITDPTVAGQYSAVLSAPIVSTTEHRYDRFGLLAGVPGDPLYKLSGPAYNVSTPINTNLTWVFNDHNVETLHTTETMILSIYKDNLLQASCTLMLNMANSTAIFGGPGEPSNQG